MDSINDAGCTNWPEDPVKKTVKPEGTGEKRRSLSRRR